MCVLFDRNELDIKPLSKRIHDLDISSVKPLDLKMNLSINKEIMLVAERIINAKNKGAANILMIGGHVIRAGIQNYIIDMMERGYISCIAMNGSGIIHDFELALIGATTESVSRYIQSGQFGLWNETGRLNDIINEAYKEDQTVGMGAAVGKVISEGDFPDKGISILAAAFRLKVPVTVHVGIGYDIIHEHPNCDGASTGALSYNDFLRFVSIVQKLEGGLIMNFGSAVMAPEVFLKALSMARNVAHQKKQTIKRFTTLVCDLHNVPNDFSKEPSKDSPAYFFRPWKTMLVRTVADGGESFYVQGKHSDTIPALWKAINENENPPITQISADERNKQNESMSSVKSTENGNKGKDERTYKIIGAAMEVHKELGSGFLEPVYQEALEAEFKSQDISYKAQTVIDIYYKRKLLEKKYQPDFVCFNEVIVEIKALNKLTGTEEAQIINYLKATGFNVGLLINFGFKSLEYKRFVCNY